MNIWRVTICYRGVETQPLERGANARATMPPLLRSGGIFRLETAATQPSSVDHAH